ncbi:MAG: 23S rRNA (adenine(2503)-C(2))-methyltransferase RlmN [Dokdonella sp.]|uniref:23S rRNA (adenine(2503)-C(2))-methyltransferase RlmN n=1 Tax=Dokdonella sp. TaxID=2291710 RepID=UPI0025BFAA64|nr:23S rRNA (adenine(2503)-C(2))-methyltransferase RlmN [Dokdonella sp.]MBX3701591.1 23S rRNA (adenine(2503)-C(2))-methyltransferase RlmN [Dokdonella sp.]MCW5577633.1 23S rRNA (adenine(2503)-C(2))-methyltransferase RlmN [Dokdonella sp.]
MTAATPAPAARPSATAARAAGLASGKPNLFGHDRNGLRALFAQLGEKPYRADQVMKWMYHRHVTDFAQMSDLGKALRDKLAQAVEIVPPNTIFEKQASDGTHKWLLGMDGGNAIEAVFIPETSRGTLCVSSQVGCALACQFCSTGAQGFNRNLSAAEIVGQVWIAARHLGNVPHHQRKLTNVVMMGMGEPLLNFDNVVTAMSVMRDDLGFGLANKRVTLSTAGLVPMIDKLGEVADVSLAVSLHAPNDELRSELMPINRKYPIKALLEACLRYTQRRARTTITFEYTMLKGVNDQPAHARQLVKLMRKVPSKVNLIPFNTFHGTQFERSDEAVIRAFQKILLDAGVLTTVRRTRGDDIDAACGQLKGQVVDRTRRQEEFRRKLEGGVADAA